MEFRDTLLAAQRNQQQQSSSSNSYYKAKFDPPKKEQKQKDRLSANIQKFLAKKDEEEKQKKIEAQRKHQELIAMRDPKALRKIQKTLKVIKSANKSVIADAVDRDNTAVTREGPDQPDQDDYGYESQEAAALYEKMMQKYSKIPDEPKFPTGSNSVKKDLNGTRERVKHALQHEDDPVPHKRRRKGGTGERDSSPPQKYEPEKKRDEQLKSDKPKIRKSLPPPIDFNQLLKLAEQKKSEPVDVAQKKNVPELETERPMTKKQKREYEEEMARRQRRQDRIEAEKGGGKKVLKEEKPIERERKPESGGFSRIPKLGDKNINNSRNDSSKITDRERLQREKDKIRMDKEKVERDREMIEREKEKIEWEKQQLELERLKAEREKLDRHIEMLNRKGSDQKTKSKPESSYESEKPSKTVDKMLDRSKIKENGRLDSKKSIDLKSQNTYRIDKNSIEKKSAISAKSSNGKYINGDSSKTVPKTSKDQLQQRNVIKEKEILAKQKSLQVNGGLKTNGRLENKKPMEPNKTGLSKKPDDKPSQKTQAGPSKPKIPAGFDFDNHINSIGKNPRKDGARKFPPGDVRRKPNVDDPRRKPKRRLNSDSEYDSEMDDFIDDGDENMDYSSAIKEIFGYDKSKYRYMDDDDDPDMESSFARQQREEYISKKIGIMEDLEDMRMEAMEKKKSKKKRRISDD